jgi:hypothetical protein
MDHRAELLPPPDRQLGRGASGGSEKTGGYRAFLLVNWPRAPSKISKEFVEDLLKEDMPEFIREALQRRLLNWQ